MNNNLKSLAQIAAELELSKQAVYKRVNGSPDILEQLQPHTVTNGTRKYYTQQGQKIIKDLFTFRQSQLNLIDVNQSKPETTDGNNENTANIIEERQQTSTTVNQSKATEVNTSEPETTTDNQSGACSDTGTAAALEALTEQLKVKDSQITEKDRQLSEANARIAELTKALTLSQEQQRTLTEALTAAQALHAGTLQKQLIAKHEEQAETTQGAPEDPPRASEPEQESEQKRSLFARLFKRSKKQR